jgi:hypothetical protein
MGNGARGSVAIMAVGLMLAARCAFSQVVLNEIHYHPASKSRADEFVELHNRTENAVSLAGWQLTGGVRFAFPVDAQLPPGGFVIVADRPSSFTAPLPADIRLFGPYKGKLSRSADRIELRRPDGHLADYMEYEDTAPWPIEPDGRGPSLERVNPASPPNCAAAWRASRVPGGTPGRANSTLDTRTTVWLRDGAHSPPIPTSRDRLRLKIFATMPGRDTSAGTETNPGAANATVFAFWRIDGTPVEHRVPMTRSTETPDQWSAEIGPFPDGTLIEYRFSAAAPDAPAAAAMDFPAPVAWFPQGYLVQVEDTPATTTRPLWRLWVRSEDWSAFEKRPVFEDNLVPATFVAGDEIRQRAQFRYRGSSSRVAAPRKSYLVRLPRWEKFLGRRDLALNADRYEAQYLAMKSFTAAGIEAPEVDMVSLRINGNDTGFYCLVERIDEDFARNHFGDDEAVTLWKGASKADLIYRGGDPKNYAGYEQVSPKPDEFDPQPIIGLCQALAEKDPEAWYHLVSRAADIEQWVRFFAVNALIANIEGGIFTYKGEDYYLAQRRKEGRFILLPWDMNESLLIPCAPVTLPQLDSVRGFLSHPKIAPLYRAEILRQAESRFSPESRRRMVAELEDVADAITFPIVRQFLDARPDELRAQLEPEPEPSVSRPAPLYLIEPETPWKFFFRAYPPKGEPGHWTQLDYDDTVTNEWYDAPMPFGYAPGRLSAEGGKGAYVPPPKAPGEITFYVRRRFHWKHSRPPAQLRLMLRHSAGWVAYLNGTEVGRGFLPEGPIQQDTPALALNPYVTAAAIDLRPHAALVRRGENVLAIESHMASPDDPRRVLDASLIAEGEEIGDILFGESNIIISGRARYPPVTTIRVGEQLFPVDTWTARWEGELDLKPGWNRPRMNGLTAAGEIVSTTTLAWYAAPKTLSAPRRIEHSVTWGGGAIPYRVREDLEIAPGATLRIEPGAVVALDPWVKVLCRGRLIAEGTPEEPIYFLAADRAAHWGSLVGLGKSSEVTLRHVELRGSSMTLRLPPDAPRSYTLSGVEVWGGTLLAEDCRVRETSWAAFGGGGGAEVALRRCRMERTGAGFMSWNSAWLLEDCVVLRTRNKGDGIDIDDEGPRRGLARRCVFAFLDDDGIDLGNSSARIEDCVVWRARDKGISLDGGGTPEFVRCWVGGCDPAVAARPPVHARFENSIFTDSNITISTWSRERRPPGGKVTLDNCVLARCATPFDGPPASIHARNVWLDTEWTVGEADASPVTGTIRGGLRIFPDPETGDGQFAIVPPLAPDAPPLPDAVALRELARRAGVRLGDAPADIAPGW